MSLPIDYFERSDTPAINSPIGKAMRMLNLLYPGMKAEELRDESHRRMHSAGPGQIRWSKEESSRLKELGDLHVAG